MASHWQQGCNVTFIARLLSILPVLSATLMTDWLYIGPGESVLSSAAAAASSSLPSPSIRLRQPWLLMWQCMTLFFLFHVDVHWCLSCDPSPAAKKHKAKHKTHNLYLHVVWHFPLNTLYLSSSTMGSLSCTYMTTNEHHDMTQQRIYKLFHVEQTQNVEWV